MGAIDKATLIRIALDFAKVWEDFTPSVITEQQKKYFIEGFVAGGLGLDRQAVIEKLQIDFHKKSHQHLLYCIELGWEMSDRKKTNTGSEELLTGAIAPGEEALLAKMALKSWNQWNSNIFIEEGKNYFIKAYVLGGLGFDRRAADVKMSISKNSLPQEFLKCVEQGWGLGCKRFANRHAKDIFEYIPLLERITLLEPAKKDCIFKAYMLAILGIDKQKAMAKLRIEWNSNLTKSMIIGWERGNEEFTERAAKVKALFLDATEDSLISNFCDSEEFVKNELAKLKEEIIKSSDTFEEFYLENDENYELIKMKEKLINFHPDDGNNFRAKTKDIDSELEELRKQLDDM